MYSVKLGYHDAVKRIKALSKHGHEAEALLAVSFTVEKTIRRTFKQLIVSSGFKSTVADQLLRRLKGLQATKDSWEIFEPQHRKLPDIIGPPNWAVIQKTSEMRNQLVHGTRVFELKTCRSQTSDTLTALDNTKLSFSSNYGFDGWTNISSRKVSKLHTDPKVRL
ncbi:MAG: hypothetical protein MK186_06005 [Henriciella sp.]|nr:hypothetical protein [Henriciella sp.]